MSRRRRLVALSIVVAIATIGGLGWRALQPKVKGATMAELRAVIPPEVLNAPPHDLAAEARFETLMKILPDAGDDRRFEPLAYGAAGTPEQTKTAEKYYETYWPLHPTVISTLEKGRLSVPAKELEETVGLTHAVRIMSEAAAALGVEGEHAKATQLFVDSYRLGDAIIHSDGGAMSYLNGGLATDIVLASISDVASRSKLTPAECKELLRLIPPTDEVDGALISSFKSQVMLSLHKLTNARKAWQFVFDAQYRSNKNQALMIGTYDAIETARTLGQLAAEEIENAKKPASPSHLVRDRINADVALLPVNRSRSSDGAVAKTWKNLLYEFSMNQGRNTIGRLALRNLVFDMNLEWISSARPAQVEQTRAALSKAAGSR